MRRIERAAQRDDVPVFGGDERRARQHGGQTGLQALAPEAGKRVFAAQEKGCGGRNCGNGVSHEGRPETEISMKALAEKSPAKSGRKPFDRERAGPQL